MNYNSIVTTLTAQAPVPGPVAIPNGGFDPSVMGMIMNSGLVAKLVLLVLFVFSLVSWAIMIHKLRLYRKVKMETSVFTEAFARRGQLDQIYNLAKKLKNCPMARVFLAGYIELATQFRITQSEQASDDEELLLEKLDSIGRALERATAQEVTKLERWLIFLGTTGSVTPFVGLFGTVWGVMSSFVGIGAKGTASIAAVAPGIAEALIATAGGLFVAIPAVIGYNYFIYRVKIKATDMDNFSLDMLSLIDRVYIKRST
ncbi:Tol-Pal system protein TolQ [hydrothermal vent metagenome]|uniref:Tol-Pal system protein TolQ n=1 Tax=hydrothermal vent metagenome TaxID=652676 RepID=A0A3B1C1E9_9ZZZZ